MDSFPLFWVIAGLSLMLLEFIIPGLVVIFLGFAAILVGLALNFGFIEGLIAAMTAWFIGSIFLVLAFRQLLLKFAPTGEVSKAKLGDQVDLVGQIVTVVDPVHPEAGGRIFFQDSTWPAVCPGTSLPKGAKARILSRVNLTYEVEPVVETIP